jgi:acyl-coenzyme A thioesterase PaaI-like protein
MNAAERAFLATREVGLHVYGHLLGLWCTPLESGSCEGTLEIAKIARDDRGLPAFGVLASLGDIAMQTALLAAYPGKRLITRTLNVRRVASQTCIALKAVAKGIYAGDGYAMSEAAVSDEKGDPVAFLSATFVPIDTPEGWRPLPWEAGMSLPSDEQLSRCAPLSAHEREAAKALNELIALADSYGDLLGTAAHDKSTRVQWHLKPHLLNRAGEGQGGAIFGAHGEALTNMLPSGAHPIEQTVTFFRSIKVNVRIEADLLYAGRRFASRTTRMRDESGNLTSVSCTEYELDHQGRH